MSSKRQFLTVYPAEIQFPFELQKQISCDLRLFNVTDSYIAFKVLTTAPIKYCVRPNSGLVLPQSSGYVTVTMRVQRDIPHGMQCNDKFLVRSVVAPFGCTVKDVNQELFKTEVGKEIHVVKLLVSYVGYPRLPSPVAAMAEMPKDAAELKATRIEVNVAGRLEDIERLSNQPLGLKFRFELKRQISCTLRLLNATDDYIAFKVMITDIEKYCVLPALGVVSPRNRHDVTVTMQAQPEAPSNMQCNDKFLVQSVVAPFGTKLQGVLQNGMELAMHEVKLSVFFVGPDQLPLQVAEPAEKDFCPTLMSRTDNENQSHVTDKGAQKDFHPISMALTDNGDQSHGTHNGTDTFYCPISMPVTDNGDPT